MFRPYKGSFGTNADRQGEINTLVKIVFVLCNSKYNFLKIKIIFPRKMGSGELAGEMLLVRIIENNKFYA